ncbi:MAG: Sua5/YciO/YrdC/YwlC family protein [Muribaculaceae bacterium]|nr:Sua5/YciO/YrdC/YwlC family protein [Muribaculaceae bacterium]MDE6286066.1 Sua5/YciO/YrdC/YwlC family protein [Muribaculaceae bacterium]
MRYAELAPRIISAAEAAAVLARGGVIAYPTETVWGIGCDATRSDAVRRIFEIKHRAEAKALITLVQNIAMLERWVDDIPEVGYQLLEAAVHPLTIVYDSPRGLAPELLATDGSAGVRVVPLPLFRSWHKPIVSTSANISGQPAPRSIEELSPEIVEAVDAIVDPRDAPPAAGRPSTVIKLSAGGLFKILRP